MKVSLDTNILIDEPHIVFDKTREFVISFTVIRELDKLKRNPDVKRAAQAAIRSIWMQFKDDKIEILNIPDLLGESPDEKIIQDTKDDNASILSNDIAVRIIAKAHNIPISDFEGESVIDYDYSGYTIIKGNLIYEERFRQIKELQIDEFNETFKTKLKENEYCIIDRMVEKNDIWVHKDGRVNRISQSMKPYRDAGILLDPMDDIQMCALDAVFDKDVPLTVIDGKLGTGKTLLSLMGLLACSVGQKRFRAYKQILVTKPPVSINRDLYTGYKPGTREEKMSGHLGGLMSNLSFLLDRESTKDLKPGEEPPPSESEKIWYEYFKVIEIDEIQGMSVHDSGFMIDEYQLLNTDGLKLALSRISEGSKMILIGDTQGQTYGTNRADEGFKTLYKYLGSAKEFNYIKLENIYRSKLAEFVEEVFKEA